MRFSSRTDLEMPIQTVFDRLSDFPRFEAAARKRGAEVKPIVAGKDGRGWDMRFRLRGRMRSVKVVLDRFERPDLLTFDGESKSFTLALAVTLVALSRSHTRLGVEVDIRPRTLSGRLLLQSARLMKSGYARKFDEGVKAFAERILETGPPRRA